MSLKKSYVISCRETIFKGLCVFVSNGDRWDGVKFHFIITPSASLPLMQTDNHIPLKDNGRHNRRSAFAVKAESPSQFLSARSITSALWKPLRRISSLITEHRPESQASQEAKRSNDLHKGGKPKAEWLTRPWKVDAFIKMTGARCLAERRTGHHRTISRR